MITVDKLKPSFPNIEVPEKIIAVAYVRVSTDHEDQLNSFQNQLDYWKEYIEKEGYIFGGVYADEGLSGTSTKKRDDFNRMISDASEGKFNLIFTKSVQRFARNTVDCLQFTRYLKSLNIGVYFQLDNIHTLSEDGELRLSLMATLAQEESRKISENVKWGHKRAMKKGIVYGSNRVWGYDIIDKKLVINPKEAEIVKKIYDWYIQGESLHAIVRLLAEIGITSGKTGGNLNHTSIRRILSNEKYCGILKQGKYSVIDFLTHKRTKNKEAYDIKYDNHEPIIDFETWQQVQIKLNHNKEKFQELGIGYTKHVWGNKLICGCCGAKYRRKTMKNADGSPRPVYICNNYYEKGKKGCSNGKYIREDNLEIIFMDVFKQFNSNEKEKEIILKGLFDDLNESISEDNDKRQLGIYDKELSQIKSKKNKLLDIYLDENSKMSKEDYNTKNEELNIQENQLLDKIDKIQNRAILKLTKEKKMKRIYDFMRNKINSDEFDKELVKELLDKIIIDKSILKIFLTVGKEFDVDLSKYPKKVNHTEYYSIMDTMYRHDVNVELNRYIDYEIEVYIAV